MWIAWAYAVPLHVPVARVDEFVRAKASLFPDGDLQITGQPVDWAVARALVFDGEQVTYIRKGTAYLESVGEDAATVVLLVRSWLRRAPVASAFVPLSDESLPEEPVVVAELPHYDRRPNLVVSGGAALALSHPRGVEGPRISASVAAGPWSVQLAGAVSVRPVNRPLQAEVERMEEIGISVGRQDRFAAQAEVCHSLFAPPSKARFWTLPRFCGGGFLRSSRPRYWGVVPWDLAEVPRERLQVGQTGSVGVDLWFTSWIGARAALHLDLRLFPQGSQVVEVRSWFGLSLVGRAWLKKRL